MISNLEQSGDFEAACHNAFEKTGAQIQQQADAYLKAGNFPTAAISGRALSMTRDFKPVQLASEDVPIAMADLLYASGHTAEAATAYKALKGPEGSEGLALMDLDDQKDKEARTALKEAIDAGSKSARAWLELGRLQSDADLLKKASDLNPRWGEPYFELAELDAGRRQRAARKTGRASQESHQLWTRAAAIIGQRWPRPISPPRISPRRRRPGQAPNAPPPTTKSANTSAKFVWTVRPRVSTTKPPSVNASKTKRRRIFSA